MYYPANLATLAANELLFVIAVLALMRGGRLERPVGALLLLRNLFDFLTSTHKADTSLASFLVFEGFFLGALVTLAARYQRLWMTTLTGLDAAWIGLGAFCIAADLRLSWSLTVAMAAVSAARTICLAAGLYKVWVAPPRRPPPVSAWRAGAAQAAE